MRRFDTTHNGEPLTPTEWEEVKEQYPEARDLTVWFSADAERRVLVHEEVTLATAMVATAPAAAAVPAAGSTEP